MFKNGEAHVTREYRYVYLLLIISIAGFLLLRPISEWMRMEQVHEYVLLLDSVSPGPKIALGPENSVASNLAQLTARVYDCTMKNSPRVLMPFPLQSTHCISLHIYDPLSLAPGFLPVNVDRLSGLSLPKDWAPDIVIDEIESGKTMYTRVNWRGVSANALYYASVCLFVVSVARMLVQYVGKCMLVSRVRRGLCSECGHQLFMGRCNECGRGVGAKDPIAGSTQPSGTGDEVHPPLSVPKTSSDAPTPPGGTDDGGRPQSEPR